MKVSHLDCYQWNTRYLSTNKDELGYVLARSNYHVVMLQSVKMKRSDMPNYPGYNLVSHGVRIKNKLVSTAIYVDNRLNAQAIKSPIKRENDSSSCAAKIILQNGKTFTYISCYYPNGMENVDLSYLDTFTNKPNHSYVVAGDFNHPHTDWSSSPNAKDTRTLFSEAIQSCPLQLLNDKSPTRQSDCEDASQSTLDLTLVSSNIGDSSWVPLPGYRFNSDHYPIHISTPVDECYQDISEAEPKFNFEEADWGRFESMANDIQIKDIVDEDIDSYNEKLNNKLTSIAEECIPKTVFKEGDKYSPWWNKECEKAIQDEIYYSNFLSRIKDIDAVRAHKLAKETRKKTVSQAKLDYWKNKAEEITDYRDIGKMWRLVKKARRKNSPPKTSIVFNGIRYFSDKDKAKILAQQIAEKSQNKSLSHAEQDRRKVFEQQYSDPLPDNSLDYNQPISMEEFDLELQNIKNKSKASGKDKITYQIINKLPNKIKEIYLDLFNKCLEKNYIPQSWKIAEVFTLLKHGKPADDPDSYRPISLTPHSGKIFERILNARLVHFLEKNNILPKEQAGFRRFRCTTDNLTYLTERMKQTLRHKNKHMFTSFFDVKKAFDRVWHVKLLEQLKKIGINGNLYYIIKNFLSDRYMQVKIGSELSETQKLDMGTPQGAVLSPTLFSIMLHDINKVNIEDNEILLYADDIALLSQSFQIRKKCNSENKGKSRKVSFQKAIDNLTAYMNDLGFQFSGQKTQFMVVSRQSDLYGFKIFVEGNKVESKQHIKYLGITFERKLCWNKHIKNVVTSSTKLINLIKYMAGQKWAKGTKFLVDLVRSLIRSRVSYGQECFFGASNSDLELLNTLERTALKIALGLPKWAPNDTIYPEVQWLTLREERLLRCSQYIIRAQISHSNPIHKCFSDKEGLAGQVTADKLRNTPRFDRTTVTIWEFTQNVREKLQLNFNKVEQFNPPRLLRKDYIKPHFFTTLEKGTKKSDNLNKSRITALEMIDRDYKDYLQVYTDGSVQDNGKTGLGVIFKAPGEYFSGSISLRTDDQHSTFSVEMTAILTALEKIEQHWSEYMKIVILTDSLSSIQALQNYPKQRFTAQNKIARKISNFIKEGKSIAIGHIPSHCDIKGNDLADKLAKDATKKDIIDIKMTYTRREAYRILWNSCKTNFEDFPSNQDYPELKGIYPNIPKTELLVLRKMRTRSARLWAPFETQICSCGKEIKFDHIFDNCRSLSKYTRQLNNYMSENELDSRLEFINYHETLGWQPARFLIKTIMESPIAFAYS